MEGIWTGHRGWVQSLSWSPSGGHLASASSDGRILIRTAVIGDVEVRLIKTNQSGVETLAYSPSGELVASSGWNQTICIWDTKTEKLVVHPINAQNIATSLLWSPDGSKLYSASGNFSRVFDSKSGVLLHHFKHDNIVKSIALSREKK